MIFTGERVIPLLMDDARDTQAHLARYVWAMHPFCTHKKVLDIACGAGYGTQILSYAANAVLGADRDSEAVSYAQKLYGNPKANFVVCDASKLAWKFGLEKFDTVVSFETIEHLKDPVGFVKQVSQVLVPGGLFIVSAPENSGSTWHEKDYTKQDLEGTLIEGYKWAKMVYYVQNFGDESIVEWNGIASSQHPTHLFVCQKDIHDVAIFDAMSANAAVDMVR